MTSDDWIKVVAGGFATQLLRVAFDKGWPLLFDRAAWRRRLIPWATKEARDLALATLTVTVLAVVDGFVLYPFDKLVTGGQVAKVAFFTVMLILYVVIFFVQLVQFLIKRDKLLAAMDAEKPEG